MRIPSVSLSFLALLPLLASLFSACSRKTTADASRIDSLTNAHIDLLYTAPAKADSAFLAIEKMAADSAQIQRLRLFRASARLHMTDSATARTLFAGVERWCRQNPKEKSVEGQLWNHRGVMYMEGGQRDSAIVCFERAFRSLNSAEKNQRTISTTLNLADLYQRDGNIPQAANYYRYAQFLCDSLHDRSSLNATLCGLGQVYAELNNFELAHKYLDRAAKTIDGEQLTSRFYYYTTLGNCLYFEKRYDEAIAVFRQAQTIAQQLHQPIAELQTEANLGETYLMNGHLDEARRHLERATSLFNGAQGMEVGTLFYIQSLRADLYIAQGKQKEARKLLDTLPKKDSVTSPRYLMLHYERLQHYAAKEERWREAYLYQSKAAQYADTLRGQQTVNNVAEMAIRYQRDTTLLAQRLAIADYKAQTAQQRTVMFAGLAVVLIVMLTAGIGMMWYRLRTSRRIGRQKEQIMELRMDIVRNRVSPHFIFNVLGTIFPRLARHTDVGVPLELLIDVLRGNLLTSGRMAVSLKDEVALVKNFVSLHHLSKGEYPKVEWHIDDALRTDERTIPSMSIQIPVENALKHAFPTLNETCCIAVRITTDESDALVMEVCDNGRGYDPGSVKRTKRDTGTGLRLLSRTLEMLNGRNAHPASFTIKNRPAPDHGTLMRMVIPRHYDFGENPNMPC